MEPSSDDFSHIKGWGIDADPSNDPTHPIKRRTNVEHEGYEWDRPAQQRVNVEVLHSIERPNVTAVFGDAVPPRGLSGMIRRLAFKHSESSYGHWLPLLLADRVNMVEGIVDDLKEGHVPNIFSERGWGAEWKYNRAALLGKCALGIALTAAALAMISRRDGDGCCRLDDD